MKGKRQTGLIGRGTLGAGRQIAHSTVAHLSQDKDAENGLLAVQTEPLLST